ncbi:conserved hypothetical protein [Pseudarthrobacter chlorophenolicus A6]|uniref:DUF3592 domain-containing protein n=1 Tax=Pseudarthrobacter chlorophenolicus (strain ATCC 700700 / DSM 12829 / CIP 107037 / JCM 12360 / KCTC 9906 / NCIMB 13794 / A6) TaxID=452863 RepID=B8H9V6_PSECP|nr:DUF3592 domain-containing protein [Pseudarthrobacter chlorophenolicus]ACL38340.1 conserved hypothetical protein [Pseudarthrobacter chlorophenolicus A6]
MRIILYIVWALFVVAAAFAMVHAIRKTRRQEQLMASWPKVQATVTGSVAGWTSGGGGSSRSRRFFPTYQFTDPRGTLFMGKSEISTAAVPAPGSLIEVAYNPGDPNESLQVSSAPRTTLGCLVPFFAVFAVALFWFISVFPLG